MNCRTCGAPLAEKQISRGRYSFTRLCDDCRHTRRSKLTSERFTQHGHNTRRGQSPTYKVWHGMKQRCGNPKDQNWRYYGGRGIAVCARWHEFTNFLADMGERPIGMTLDRINGDGNYEPGNCRWATMKEQCNNWSGGGNTHVNYKGGDYTLQELSDKLGLNRYTLRRRIFDMKWPEERWAEAPQPRRNQFSHA